MMGFKKKWRAGAQGDFLFDSISTPKIRRWIFTVVALALTASATGCMTKHHDDGDELGHAQSLINQGNDSEAIFILTKVVKDTPQNLNARTMLASAYAHRGGMILLRYKNFAAEILKWDKSKDYGLLNSGDPVVSALSKTLWHIQLVIRAFDSIPVSGSPSSYDDLKQALQVLDEGGRLTGGPSIYRALLRLTIFKHDLSTKYRLQKTADCQIQKDQIVHWLESIHDDLENLITDVAYGMANPTTREDTLNVAADVRKQITIAIEFVSKISKETDLGALPSLGDGMGFQCN